VQIKEGMILTTEHRYFNAKEAYKRIGVDTDYALEKLNKIHISMHCWQGDDVRGFDHEGPLSGGIQATGNYPGRAGSPEELMQDIDMAFSLVPGRHKINLHACYAIFDGNNRVDRDKLSPIHFERWADFAKERGIGIDFNPTFFSHPKAEHLTLSSPDEDIRNFWIEHGKACIRISEYLATQTGMPCVMNIWIPDGYKDVPADRYTPRARFKDSLDKILSVDYDKSKVIVTLESKVFGIGLESYTVGSHEFCLKYAAEKGILCLMDNGHYHPTEVVSDKISSMLLFDSMVALHVTRPVRWDSDHVVLFDDETREIAKEIIKNDAADRVLLALDFFDASINRIAAWVVGMRNMQKALLYALLTPHRLLGQLQESGDFTKLMVLQEELKLYPFGDVWNYFCKINHVPEREDYLASIRDYESRVLLNRR
jgi:L-rhamnose isomerase